MKKNNLFILGIGGICLLLIGVALGRSFQGKGLWGVGSPMNSDQTTTEQTRAKTGTAVLYGKIASLSSHKNGEGLNVQLVEWVQGSDNQEQAALETGWCDLEKVEKDQCLSNPFFVRDTGKNMTLPVASDVRVQVYARNKEGGMKSNASGDIYLENIDLNGLKELMKTVGSLKEIPFIFTTANGTITQLVEQYIP